MSLFSGHSIGHHVVLASLALASAACLSACGMLFPNAVYVESEVYDFGIPLEAPALRTCHVEIRSFASEGALRTKMRSRANRNLLFSDEYNRWAQPPGALLSQYLSLYFAKSTKNTSLPAVVVSGTILNCEADRTERRMLMTIRYSTNGFGPSKTVLFRSPMKSLSAKSFAEAASLCAEQFARMLYAELAAYTPTQTEK